MDYTQLELTLSKRDIYELKGIKRKVVIMKDNLKLFHMWNSRRNIVFHVGVYNLLQISKKLL